MSRLNAHRRGYTGQWERGRAAFLEAYPYCIGCSAVGLSVQATVADHVIPHEGDQSKFWTELQPLCKWHHDSIKPTLERQWRAGKLPDAGLWLNSKPAITLTKARHRPAVGADGFAIEGT